MNYVTADYSQSPKTKIGGASIMVTSDYDRFSFDDTNRPLDMTQVMSLVDEIKRKNMLPDFPILVDSKNRVLDGQHRLEAARTLGVPIYYKVARNVTIDDIARTNQNTKGWTPKDYLHRFVNLGYVDYIKLADFLEKYPFLTIAQARNLCNFGDKAGMTQRFKAGSYEFNDNDFADLVAQRLIHFRDLGYDFYNHNSFVYAISNLSGNVNYEHEKLLQKLEYLSSKLVKCPDMSSFISLINEIYNYRARNYTHLSRLQSSSNDYRPDRKAKKAAS